MTNDAHHSAPTPLSRFLGGWMRHPSPQEPEQVTDDAEVTEAAEAVEAAEATEAAESAVSPEAASTDGPAVSAEVAGPEAAPDRQGAGAPSAAAAPWCGDEADRGPDGEHCEQEAQGRLTELLKHQRSFPG